MNSKRFKLIFATIILALTMSACSDFLDINKDPNNPTEVSLALLLPYSQTSIVGAVDNSAGGLSSYTQTIMGQYTQRGNLSDYGLQPDDFAIQIAWGQFYTEALTDLDLVISKGTEEKSWHYVGIGQVMKAYLFSVAVDLWGDVPFSQAGLGSENPFPVYDNGEVVYDGIFTLLDEAIANFNQDAPAVTSDLFYDGNPDQWRKLAKTLKLKLLNQVRLVQDVTVEVNALVAEGDLILSIEDDWELPYGTSISPENRNPGFVQEWTAGGQFYFVNPYFFETMRGTETFFPGGNIFQGIADPRIPYYFFNQLADGESDADAQNACAYCPSVSGTPFLSIYAFSFNIDPNEGFDQGRSQTVAGLYPLGGRFNDGAGGVAANASSLTAGQVTGPGNVPQRLLTSFQTKYILAELAQAGIIGGDPRGLLQEAIEASFEKVNEVAELGSAPAISTTAIDDYVNDILAVYDGGAELQVIMTQKWIASFGYGIDSYNDYRRTGFPVLHDGNTDNVAVTVRTKDFPVSIPHELQDLITNPNAPPQRVIGLDRVFWDPN